jgi:hypothetical protein
MNDSLFAEFTSIEAILRAAEHLRARGIVRMNAYTPCHVPELEEILGIRRSRIPVGVFLAGITGTTVAYLILWYTNAVSFPLNVGAHPLNSFVSDIPIMFETTVLFAGGSAFVLALALNGLPRLYRPIADVEGSHLLTLDRYWLEVSTSDPRYEASIRDALTGLGAVGFRGAGGAAG